MGGGATKPSEEAGPTVLRLPPPATLALALRAVPGEEHSPAGTHLALIGWLVGALSPRSVVQVGTADPVPLRAAERAGADCRGVSIPFREEDVPPPGSVDLLILGAEAGGEALRAFRPSLGERGLALLLGPAGGETGGCRTLAVEGATLLLPEGDGPGPLPTPEVLAWLSAARRALLEERAAAARELRAQEREAQALRESLEARFRELAALTRIVESQSRALRAVAWVVRRWDAERVARLRVRSWDGLRRLHGRAPQPVRALARQVYYRVLRR
jgi:hypothetical protein